MKAPWELRFPGGSQFVEKSTKETPRHMPNDMEHMLGVKFYKLVSMGMAICRRRVGSTRAVSALSAKVR